jgi:osmotically inducible protein OsmC
MLLRKANAVWEGTLKEGKGRMRLGSGAWEGPYSFESRFASGTGTNPEELIGAAHAGCFSMALAAMLTEAGHPPTAVRTEAEVGLEAMRGGYLIKSIRLTTTGVVPGISETDFKKHAENAKKNCPVSKALGSAVEILLEAKLADR